MNGIVDILAKYFPGEDWYITRPPAGLQKEAYVVASKRRRLLLKFDTEGQAWQRLAEIGVTPPLIGMGTHAGRPYIVQTFSDGIHPDRAWFAANVGPLARLMKHYHEDTQLGKILSATYLGTYHEHVHRLTSALEKALAVATADLFESERFRHAFDLFREQARRLQPVPPVPVHPDPSPANMLVSQAGILFVDWDDVLLSDPEHDAGLIAWWYLPQARWEEFFGGCGAPFERERIFWWVARRSLEVALWFDARQVEGQTQAFLDDFYRTVGHEPNPRVGE